MAKSDGQVVYWLCIVSCLSHVWSHEQVPQQGAMTVAEAKWGTDV